MSIKAIGPRRFEIRVQWYDPKTGRKRGIREMFEGDKRGAKSRHDALRAERKEAADKPKRQRLAAFARSWMESRVLRIKPSTAKRYAISLDIHILPILGDYWLDKLDRDDVQQYVNARAAAGAQGHTVRNELQVLRTMARESFGDGLAPRNWADRVTPPELRKWSEDRPNLMTERQLFDVLGAVPRRWLAAVTLSAYSGLRWGELSGLRWGDIEEDGRLRIRRSNWRGRIGTPKNASSTRSVALPPPVAAMLAASAKGAPGDLLFPNREGKLHRGWPLVKVMHRACAAAGVPYTTPHGLRRTFNNLARKVASAQVVKSITGHATDAMLEHYSLIGVEEKAEVVHLVMALVSASATTRNPEMPPDGVDLESGANDE